MEENNNKIISKKNWSTKFGEKLDAFIQSDWFILSFALAVALTWILNLEYSLYLLMGVIMTYILFSQKSLKPMLPMYALFFMAYSYGDRWTYVHFVLYLICGIFFVTGVIYRFYLLYVTRTKFKTGHFLIPMLVAFLAVLLGGLGFEGYDFSYLPILIGISSFFVFIYITSTNFIKDDIRSYVCKILLACSIVCIIEMIVWFVRCPDIISTITQNSFLRLGWTNANGIAIILVMTVIMLFYKASGHIKYTAYYVLMPTICVVALMFTFSKIAIFTGLIIIPIVWVFGYVKAKNRQSYMIFSIMCIICVAIIVALLTTFMPALFDSYEQFELQDNNKFDIYRMAIRQFFEQPLFGCGIFGETDINSTSLAWKIPCTPIQVLYSTGIVGVILLISYYYKRFKIQTEYFSKFKFFALFAVIAFEFYGLFGVSFLSIYLNILVLIIVIACEKETEMIKLLRIQLN